MCPVPVPTDERPYHHGRLRAALLRAAEERLREHGADRLSLRDLAREIGVSHAAPRRHFPDRQALLDALAVAGFARLDIALRTALADADDFPARVRAVATTYIRFATENAALLELMYAAKHRPGAEEILEAADVAFAVLSGLIVEGQGQAALQAGDPERVGMVLFATVHGIASMINADILRPEQIDELVETAVEQFLRGARPIP